jgi:hypothetical protein
MLRSPGGVASARLLFMLRQAHAHDFSVISLSLL